MLECYLLRVKIVVSNLTGKSRLMIIANSILRSLLFTTSNYIGFNFIFLTLFSSDFALTSLTFELGFYIGSSYISLCGYLIWVDFSKYLHFGSWTWMKIEHLLLNKNVILHFNWVICCLQSGNCRYEIWFIMLSIFSAAYSLTYCYLIVKSITKLIEIIGLIKRLLNSIVVG